MSARSSSSPTSEDSSSPGANLAKDRVATTKPPGPVVLLVCVVFTAFNLYLFNAAGEHKILTFQDVVKLRRPNQFLGLERVNTLSNASDPIFLHPLVLSQLNQAEPRRAYGDDEEKFASWNGSTPPVDRQFKVTSKTSSVVQFQAIDYKMENCALRVITPTTSSNSTFKLGPESNLVDIWTLNAPYPIYTKTLSWNTRPSRVRKLETINISHGMNYTHHFPCPLNSIHTFEFSAVDESTHIEWSQDHGHSNPSVSMMQQRSDSASVEDSRTKTLRQRLGTYLHKASPSLSWSIPKPEKVVMHIIPESVNYHLGSDAWKNLLPAGGHAIHIANSDDTVDTYTVAMFHQLRCLEILHDAYADEGSHRTSLLAQHCLNYIRQTLLCQMDMRCEPQGSTQTINGDDTMCNDWEPIYEEAARNFEAYSRYVD